MPCRGTAVSCSRMTAALLWGVIGGPGGHTRAVGTLSDRRSLPRLRAGQLVPSVASGHALAERPVLGPPTAPLTRPEPTEKGDRYNIAAEILYLSPFCPRSMTDAPRCRGALANYRVVRLRSRQGVSSVVPGRVSRQAHGPMRRRAQAARRVAEGASADPTNSRQRECALRDHR